MGDIAERHGRLARIQRLPRLDVAAEHHAAYGSEQDEVARRPLGFTHGRLRARQGGPGFADALGASALLQQVERLPSRIPAPAGHRRRTACGVGLLRTDHPPLGQRRKPPRIGGRSLGVRLRGAEVGLGPRQLRRPGAVLELPECRLRRRDSCPAPLEIARQPRASQDGERVASGHVRALVDQDADHPTGAGRCHIDLRRLERAGCPNPAVVRAPARRGAEGHQRDERAQQTGAQVRTGETDQSIGGAHAVTGTSTGVPA